MTSLLLSTNESTPLDRHSKQKHMSFPKNSYIILAIFIPIRQLEMSHYTWVDIFIICQLYVYDVETRLFLEFMDTVIWDSGGFSYKLGYTSGIEITALNTPNP